MRHTRKERLLEKEAEETVKARGKESKGRKQCKKREKKREGIHNKRKGGMQEEREKKHRNEEEWTWEKMEEGK